jgi:hypothetical protein
MSISPPAWLCLGSATTCRPGFVLLLGLGVVLTVKDSSQLPAKTLRALRPCD